jgi:hypothetical protein
MSENTQRASPAESAGTERFNELVGRERYRGVDQGASAQSECPGGAVMSRNEWLELVQLAELLCPPVLIDLPVLMELEAFGLLLWLRSRARVLREAET